MMHRKASSAAVLIGLAGMAGCSVHVNKGNSDEGKDVSIHTPFGGMEVHKNDAGHPLDVGLPAYPGAVLAAEDGGDGKSADVQMGFGPWQLHVQVANYVTQDPQPKVQEFYRKALARYGAVLTCRGQQPVGEPAQTAEGLTCRNGHKGEVANVTRDANIELKAGSEHRQHVVAFNHQDSPGTHFSLVALTLPPKSGGDRGGEE